VVVERVHNEDCKVELSGGFWPAKPKSECVTLVSSLDKKSFTGVMVDVW
jgi:hypothetical protein